MKLFGKNRIILLIIAIILGVSFSAFLIYDQKGKLENNDYLALGITLFLGIVVLITLIKIGNR
jgi:hypothetical protein